MKLLSTYILLTFGLFFFSGKILAQTQEEYLEKGKEAYKNQRFDDAITYGLKVLSEDCDEATEVYAYWLCGASYQSMAIYSEALFYEKKQSYLDSWQTHFNEGLIYANLGYDEPAIDALNESIERGNPKYTVYNCRGGVHSVHYRVDEAIADFHRSIDLVEEGAVEGHLPYMNMGVLYENIEDLDKAELWYKKALVFNPDKGEIQYAIEQIKKKKDKNYKYSKKLLLTILKKYDERIAKNRWHPYSYLRRASLHNSLGNKIQSERDYQKALELYDAIVKDIPDAWYQIRFRAMAYEGLGRTNEALADYRRVLEFVPAERYVQRKIEKLSKR